MRAKLSINDLSRLLQLSKKYMADELHSEVSEHLRILYPSDRSGYNSDRREFLVPSDRRFNHYDAIVIAERYELPIILPCALYLASRRGLHHLLDSRKVPDGVARKVHLFRTELDAFVTDLMVHEDQFAPESCAGYSDLEEDESCEASTFGAQQRLAQAYRTLSFDLFDTCTLASNNDLQLASCPTCSNYHETTHKYL